MHIHSYADDTIPYVTGPSADVVIKSLQDRFFENTVFGIY